MSLQMVEAYADPLDDDTEDDVRWFEYCHIASTLCREDILTVVLDELQSPVSPLYDLIDPALHSPHEPGRAREHHRPRRCGSGAPVSRGERRRYPDQPQDGGRGILLPMKTWGPGTAYPVADRSGGQPCDAGSGTPSPQR